MVLVIVQAFRIKLKLFHHQLSQNNTLATTAQPMVTTEKYTNMIFALDNKFANFQKLHAESDTVSSPFTTDFEKVPYAIQLELNDLQCNSTVKERFQSKVLTILCITEYIQVFQLEKNGHETTRSVWVHIYL